MLYCSVTPNSPRFPFPYFDLKEAPWVPSSAGWGTGLELEDDEQDKKDEQRQTEKRKLRDAQVSMYLFSSPNRLYPVLIRRIEAIRHSVGYFISRSFQLAFFLLLFLGESE